MVTCLILGRNTGLENKTGARAWSYAVGQWFPMLRARTHVSECHSVRTSLALWKNIYLLTYLLISTLVIMQQDTGWHLANQHKISFPSPVPFLPAFLVGKQSHSWIRRKQGQLQKQSQCSIVVTKGQEWEGKTVVGTPVQITSDHPLKACRSHTEVALSIQSCFALLFPGTGSVTQFACHFTQSQQRHWAGPSSYPSYTQRGSKQVCLESHNLWLNLWVDREGRGRLGSKHTSNGGVKLFSGGRKSVLSPHRQHPMVK